MLFNVVVFEMGSHRVLMLATPPSREPFHPTAANSRKCPEQVASPRVPSTFKFPSWPHPDLEATQIKNSHSSLLLDGRVFSSAHCKQRLLLVSVSGCETQPSGTQERVPSPWSHRIVFSICLVCTIQTSLLLCFPIFVSLGGAGAPSGSSFLAFTIYPKHLKLWGAD